MDHHRAPGPVHPASLADHLRRHHPRRAAPRRPHRTARPLPRRPAQRPGPAVPGRDGAARGVRAAAHPRLEPRRQDRRHTDLPHPGRTRRRPPPIRHQRLQRGPAWRSWGGYPSEPHWTARLSFGTPTTLVAAFTASLISTEPLHRTVQEVPVHTRRALYIATTTPMQPHGNTPVAPPPPAPVAGRTR
ncbi:DUF317 domain-containing protein [Streptomyces maremycinicus]|uniref:DUF317 domain-containing protein n=1 Tax=Streptomyces maremycinicus TaxID=1679753 RepID=UPI001F3ACC42|nr:DUF317 domain-containing protein [Streptomyces sp. NBRC 110468]